MEFVTGKQYHDENAPGANAVLHYNVGKESESEWVTFGTSRLINNMELVLT